MGDYERALLFFWLGFSLVHLPVIWTWRFSIESGSVGIRGKKIQLFGVSVFLKIIASVVGVAGAYAVAAYMSAGFRGVFGGELPFLAGAALGVVLCIALYPWR